MKLASLLFLPAFQPLAIAVAGSPALDLRLENPAPRPSGFHIVKRTVIERRDEENADPEAGQEMTPEERMDELVNLGPWAALGTLAGHPAAVRCAVAYGAFQMAELLPEEIRGVYKAGLVPAGGGYVATWTICGLLYPTEDGPGQWCEKLGRAFAASFLVIWDSVFITMQ
jgi:hypothetical protein